MSQKSYTDSFLDEIEQTKLRDFYQDEIMREAVRKVILAGLYENGTLKKRKAANPLTNGAFGLAAARGDFSNEDLGADLRAMWQGLNALESAFNSMSNYLPELPERSPKPNQAR